MNESSAHASAKMLNDNRIVAHFQEIIDYNLGGQRATERRSSRRIPFPYVMRLSSETEISGTPGKTTLIIGRHFSLGGVDFYHREPLAYRRGLITIEHPSGQSTMKIVIDIRWCRFLGQHWYVSGGRYLEAVELPRSESSV